MGKSMAQDLAYRQSLMKLGRYREKTSLICSGSALVATSQSLPVPSPCT